MTAIRQVGVGDRGWLNAAAKNSGGGAARVDIACMGPELSRRDVVGTGMLLGAFVLAGCKSGSDGSSELPGPVAATGERQVIINARPPVSAPTPRGVAMGPEPDILPRSAWTGTGVARKNDINPMNGVQRITIHHDGMDAFTATDRQSAARRIELIRNSHVNGGRGHKAFADIGYHYIIDPSGRVWEGRDIRYQGAHVQDNNEHNLGIMCLGNFDVQRPSNATRSALDSFAASRMRKHNVALSRVKTHQEINPTACPGSNLQQYMLATRGSGGSLRLACASLTLDLA